MIDPTGHRVNLDDHLEPPDEPDEIKYLKELITELCDALDIWSQHQARSLIQRAREASK